MQQAHTTPLRRRRLASRRQRGVYALEWAIIFPVFFVLLYAIVCYGLTFLVRESMQYAVEEGARAALKYPSSATLGSATIPNWEHRRTEARKVAVNALSWLPTGLRPAVNDIAFAVCRVGDTSCQLCAIGDAGCPQPTLNPAQICDATTPCLVVVSYGITDYRNHAIAPGIPGLHGLILPPSLQARASILVDRRML